MTHLETEQSLADKVVGIVKFASESAECTKAFEAAGVVSVNAQFKDVTIVTENVFNDAVYDPTGWTDGSDVGKDLRADFVKHPQTNDESIIGFYKETARRFIGLTNRAISEEDDFLSVSLIHSFIHSGGIGGQDTSTWMQRNVTGYKGNDLRHMDQKLYRDIIENCTKERHSKNLNG